MNGRTAGAVLAALAALTACGAPAPTIPSSPPAVTEVPLQVIVRDDLQEVFAAAGVTGTFALLDPTNGRLTVVDRARAEKPAVPASTFKIAHSLIALATGAVRDAEEVIPYGGQPQPVPAWERDMDIREAVPASNAAVFQEIARRIGPDRERTWLTRLGYGDGEVGPAVDRFWLDGPLEISPSEQTQFLRRLAERSLPVDRAIQDTVAEILVLERGPAGTLYGKTGWRFESTPQLGWWVGWLARPDGRIHTFDTTVPAHAIDEITTALSRLDRAGQRT